MSASLMLETTHLKPADYASERWKNGRGQTEVIAADERKQFRWRLSKASISASGPFSLYPGYQRSLVLLRGGPISLSHDGKKSRELALFRNYPFKGGIETIATVTKPAEDFNVFALEGAAKANVYPTYLQAREEMQFPIAGSEHFIFAVTGELEVLEQNSGERFSLRPGETLRVSRKSTDEYLNIRTKVGNAPATCLWIVIHLLSVKQKRR